MLDSLHEKSRSRDLDTILTQDHVRNPIHDRRKDEPRGLNIHSRDFH